MTTSRSDERGPAFEKGGLVRLKSGGPVMTVDICPGEVSSYSKLTWRGIRNLTWHHYRCVWFDGNELHSDDFGEHLLAAADSPVDPS